MKAKKYTFPRLSKAKKLYIAHNNGAKGYEIKEYTITRLDGDLIFYKIDDISNIERFFNKIYINSQTSNVFTSKINAARRIIDFINSDKVHFNRQIENFKNCLVKNAVTEKEMQKLLRKYFK